MPGVRLVTRGDDAGSCRAADLAVAEACRAGLLRNVSVMAPGPSVEHAAGVLGALDDVCIGLHLTLNAEWETCRWGPVLPPEKVPSLVAADGCFHPTPAATAAAGEEEALAEEALAEAAAQLRRLRSLGLAVTYLDQHMGVGRTLGIAPRLEEFCRREGLVSAPALPRACTGIRGPDLVPGWIDWLEDAAPGDYLLVTHPGSLDPEMLEWSVPGGKPGEVARERDAERRAWLDPRIRTAIRELGTRCLRYDELVGLTV